MSNEELALLVISGERDKLLTLWAQVRPFALWQARRWARIGRGGVTIADLEQTAFLALLDALEGWRAEAGQFLTWYGFHLKAAFTEATEQRRQRDRLDPLNSALSLEAPIGDERVSEYGTPFIRPWRGSQRARERLSGGGTG